MSSHQYKQQQQQQQHQHNHQSQNGHGQSTQQQQSEEKKDGDVEFMNEVLVSIQAHYGETSIRAKFQDYVFRFVRLAAIYEEHVYHTTKIGWSLPSTALGYGPVFADDASMKRELHANAQRIEGWRQTISYKSYQIDLSYWAQNSCIKNLDVYRQISKLKRLRQIPDQEVASIYEAFLNNIITHRQMIEVKALAYIVILSLLILFLCVVSIIFTTTSRWFITTWIGSVSFKSQDSKASC